MGRDRQIVFGPFRLDLTVGRLWRGVQEIQLRARSRAVLCYLGGHPGRVISREELAQHVWVGTHVSKTALRGCVWEIRQALGDQAATPQYIETVGQQGYRFLAETRGWQAVSHPAVAPSVGLSSPTAPFVGRQLELVHLQDCLAQAQRGARQLIFVSGEVGIGKTTLVRQFLNHLSDAEPVWVGLGQCIEHVGSGEAYLPLLEALGRLGGEPEGARLVAALHRAAPTWLVHLPILREPGGLEATPQGVQGASQARMLRELVDALSMVATDTCLVLVLEDLHWSDASTVEWLAYLARRPERMRLLVLGTYRPAEVIARQHPLRDVVPELVAHRLCQELRLELLTVAEVQAYVAQRLGASPATATLGALVHRRTDGNALFMAHLLDHLLLQRWLVQEGDQWVLRGGVSAMEDQVPNGLQPLLVKQIESLTADAQQCLAVASVAGARFTAAEVAAGLQRSVEEVEAVCDGLAQWGQLIAAQEVVAWPDGTVTARYGFQHPMFRSVVYARLGNAQRVRLHRRLGERLEGGYREQARAIASTLAHHFEQGGATQRAISYWQQAGENAARRNIHHEAVAGLRKGLVLLATLPDSSEGAQQELTLQLSLGELLMAATGFASPEAGDAYTRAYALCQQVRETPQHLRVLWGLILCRGAQGQLGTADELSQQLLHLAQRQPEAGFLMEGHFAMGRVAFYRGDFIAARTHLEQSLRLSDILPPPTTSLRGGFVPGVTPLVWLVQVLWALGDADQAQQRSQEALTLARRADHSPSLALAAAYASMLSQLRRDVTATQVHVDALMTLAAAEGFTLRFEQGRMLGGWALAMRGDAITGVAHIRQGLAAYQGLGPELLRPYWLGLLAEAYSRAGQPEAGLRVLAEALTLGATTGARWWEAELHRLKGELLLQLPISDAHQAEAVFHQALDVARCQEAKALELRVVLSLGRLWLRWGRHDEARQLLAPIYGWFTEGFETVDLQEAKVQLETLARLES